MDVSDAVVVTELFSVLDVASVGSVMGMVAFANSALPQHTWAFLGLSRC
jgi:hypothetical protein